MKNVKWSFVEYLLHKKRLHVLSLFRSFLTKDTCQFHLKNPSRKEGTMKNFYVYVCKEDFAYLQTFT